MKILQKSGNSIRLPALLLVWALVFAWALPGAAAKEDAGLRVKLDIATGLREAPEAELDCAWDDGWFAGEPGAYNPAPARAAMALSASAYEGEDGTPGVRQALKDLGFERVRSYNYQAAALSAGKTAYTFGLKAVPDEKGNLVHLAAVVVRGTGSYMEWAGNLNVGEGRDHQGFAAARDELLANLERYLAQAKVTGKDRETTRFFLTGHSRGGACANLTAARLTENGDAVFAYTFAAPSVSLDGKEEGFENIFNIVRGDDLVTLVPLAEWGYRRYGTDIPLPVPGDEGYDGAFKAMSKAYKDLTGQSYGVYRDPGAVESMTASLARLAPDVKRANLQLLSALLTGDLEAVSELVEADPSGAVSLGRAALEISAVLTPLLQSERAGLTSAHCMAGYCCWLAAVEPASPRH